ncbi:isoprenylcysteine carboxylmethyltransferase family protein [Myxococcota bacterium]|nr:isoprenylcysteine carboxylmethyltransferase family protein [Myxococcota bacterium]
MTEVIRFGDCLSVLSLFKDVILMWWIPTLDVDLWNAWWLCVPFLVPSLLIGLRRRDVAARMADMTGYTTKEKAFTAVASLAPYPFMFLTVWTPFADQLPWLAGGAVLYLAGIVFFYATIRVFLVTPSEHRLTAGPYRHSRNPMYVSAGLVFFGIILMTTSLPLLIIELILLAFQHRMILAEERRCLAVYGVEFDDYMKKVPRYLWNSVTDARDAHGE